jgi:hypothetical protein
MIDNMVDIVHNEVVWQHYDNVETVVTILQTMLQDENRIYKQQ